MSDPAGQQDPYAQQPGYAQPDYPPGSAQPGYPPAAPGYGPGGGRYVPPTLDEIWFKPTPNSWLYLVTCGIWNAAWGYRVHDDLQKHNGEGLGGTVALVLGLFVGIVIWFTVPIEIEKTYQRNGWTSPVKATDGLWMLIPFAGPFIYYPKMLSALNNYWISQGSQAPAGTTT